MQSTIFKQKININFSKINVHFSKIDVHLECESRLKFHPFNYH